MSSSYLKITCIFLFYNSTFLLLYTIYSICKQMYIFNIYILMNPGICKHLKYHHCNQEIDISNTSQSFHLALWFLFYFCFCVHRLENLTWLKCLYISLIILNSLNFLWMIIMSDPNWLSVSHSFKFIRILYLSSG